VVEVKFVPGVKILQIVEIHNGIPCLITEHNPSNHVSFLECGLDATHGEKGPGTGAKQLNLKDLTDSKVANPKQEYDPVI